MKPMNHVKAQRFAIKFVIDCGEHAEPTDDALRACFTWCAMPPPADAYDMIREHIAQLRSASQAVLPLSIAD